MSSQPTRLSTAISLFFLASTGGVLAADQGPHKLSTTLGLEFRTNTDIRVAPASTDVFDFASFSDFEQAAQDEAEAEDEGSDDALDDAGWADTDLSEEELELAIDDDDGDGSEDDVDDDGVDDDEDNDDDGDGIPDDVDEDDDGDGIGDDEDDDDGGDDCSDDPNCAEGEGAADDDSLAKLVSNAAGGQSISRSQNRTTAKLGVSHKFAFENKAWAWGSSLRVASDFHSGRGELNKTNYAISTGPEFKPANSNWKFKPAISFVAIEKDSDHVTSTLVGSFAASYEFSKKLSVDGIYNYQDRDIIDPDSPDAIINTLTFGADWTITKNDIVKLKYSPQAEDSSRVSKNRDTRGWQATYSRKLPWELILGVGAKYDAIDFVNLPTRREDDVLSQSVELAKSFSKQFEMSLSFQQRELDSNIDSKDATNRSWMIGGQYKF